MAKGIAIVLVVYGHCLRGLVNAGTLAPTSPLVVTDYIVYTFHMPIFFLISGFFFKAPAEQDRWDFWVGRLRTIVYPYFLWSLIHGATKLAMSGTGAVNHAFGGEEFLSILWAPISPFWFLYALFFCNLLAYALAGVRRDLLVAGALIAFLASFAAGGGTVQDIFYGFLYFAAGMLVRERGWLGALPSSWPAAGLLVLGFFVAAFGCFYAGVPERLPFPAALLGIAATLAVCAAVERTAPASAAARFLGLVGQCSMAIYVMHVLILGFARVLLLRGLHVDSLWVVMPAAIAVAVLIPVAVQILALRLGINDLVGLPNSAMRQARKPHAVVEG